MPSAEGGRSFAVTLRSERATEVADSHGLVNRGKVLEDVYWFEEVSSVTRGEISQQLLTEDPSILEVEEQRPLWREKRGSLSPSDPRWPQQWSLLNSGQAGDGGRDINVEPAWLQGLTGSGVTVAIVDDGVFHSHSDLRDNFNSSLSVDLVDRDGDVSPGRQNNHGTACAGVVAMARDNGKCGVGVAYEATIVGVRLFSERPHTDIMESIALSQSQMDIFSNSWGPVDNGALVEHPGALASKALEIGVTKGRAGLGALYVWAAGNGRGNFDSCATDGYVGSIYTVAVGAVDQFGQRAYFDEECPGKMVVTHSHNTRHKDTPTFKTQVVTTGMKPNRCRTNFLGTSASCALLSGALALTLQANPHLSWRDVQHLLVVTADHTHVGHHDEWTLNSGGHHVSRSYGFGALDTERLVSRARVWRNVPEQLSCTLTSKPASNWTVEPGPPMILPLESTPNCPILHLEHVVATVSLTLSGYSTGYRYSDYAREEHYGNLDHLLSHSDVRRGDLMISLQSPKGTVSVLLPKRKNDFVNMEGFEKWPFMTVLNWGESPLGVWSLNFTYDPEMHTQGLVTVTNVTLTLYGTSSLPKQETLSSCELRNASNLQCVSNCPSPFLVHRGYCINPEHRFKYTNPPSQTATLLPTPTAVTPHHTTPKTHGNTTVSSYNATLNSASITFPSVCLIILLSIIII